MELTTLKSITIEKTKVWRGPNQKTPFRRAKGGSSQEVEEAKDRPWLAIHLSDHNYKTLLHMFLRDQATDLVGFLKTGTTKEESVSNQRFNQFLP
ncbi:hypothetical protein TSUD_378680 [Trifolium subterraneum]|uniref:Uncharacterized protein n=1 Tax=Trifolium subterraneum TaxID=3900 RepID=A0A2Z6NRD6_TRISU|nr:hypothetical protein TSUD_378680 [Trifolium subterraneum]